MRLSMRVAVFVAMMTLVLKDAPVQCTGLLAGRSHDQVALLESAATQPDDEKYAAMRSKFSAANFGEAGDKFVDTTKAFESALAEQIAKTVDEKKQTALKATLDAYEDRVASWSKMKLEFAESNQIKVDALSAGADGLFSVIEAIKSGDPTAAVGAGLSAIGAIAMAIPGGQAFGLAFSIFGGIFGLFSGTSSAEKPITIEDIRNVVTEAIHKEIKDFAAADTKKDLITQCKAIKSELGSVYIDIAYYQPKKIETEAEKNTVAHAILNGVEQVKRLIGETAKLYSSIDTAIETNTLVDTDPAASACFNACALMTVPFERWAANPDKIDYERPGPYMTDNYRSGWTPSDTAYWYPCPFLGSIPETKYGDARYKACIEHGTGKTPCGYTLCTEEACSMNSKCAARVDGIDSCAEKLKTSRSRFAALGEVIGCATEEVLALHVLLANLEALGAVYDYFPFLEQSYRMLLGNLDAQMQRLQFFMQHRSIAIAKTFSLNGKAYSCDDPSRRWVEAFGIETLPGSSTKYLVNGPCSNDAWWKFYIAPGRSSIKTAFSEDRFLCTKIQDSSKAKPKWDQVGPYFDYKTYTSVKWKNEFKLPEVFP